MQNTKIAQGLAAGGMLFKSNYSNILISRWILIYLSTVTAIEKLRVGGEGNLSFQMSLIGKTLQ